MTTVPLLHPETAPPQRNRTACATLGIALLGLAPAAGIAQTLELVGTIPGPATNVSAHEGRAYVSSGSTLRIFDIGQPAAPTLLGSYAFPQDVRGVRVSGSIAYVAMDFGGLGILDVADASAPTLLASIETPGQALSVAVAGSTAVVTNRLSGLEIINVSDPAAPVAQGSYFAEGYATDVDARGSFAYVVDTPGGLSIIDLTQSGEVPAVGTQPTREPSAAVAVTALDGTAGGEMIVAGLMSAESGLELFDVTDAAAPTALGSFRNDSRQRPPAFSGAAATVGLVRLRMQGPLAFLTDVYPPFQLQVVDLSTPSRPRLLTTYEPPGSPQDVALVGPLILVAVRTSDGGPGVVILRRNG